jgi:pimeloyl-ACP methyl ester carboxylesterase
LRVPTLFIGGDHDGPTQWGADAISRFDRTVPHLHGSHILADCGHWVQQEKPEEVNGLLLDFLSVVRPV